MIEVKDGQISVDGTTMELINELGVIYLSVIDGMLEAVSDDEKKAVAHVWDDATDDIAAKAHKMLRAYCPGRPEA